MRLVTSALIGALLLAGCATTSYRPDLVSQPDHGYRSVSVGTVAARDDEL